VIPTHSFLQRRIRELEDLFFFPVDARIYAVVRIAFALGATANLLALWPLAEPLFSDAGMLDEGVARMQANPFYLSIFAFFTKPAAVHKVFAGTLFALALLASGFLARAAALWVFVWHVSFTSRILIATTGWDMLQSSFSFLVLISPLGHFSMHSAPEASNGTSSPHTAPAYGLLLLRLQVLVVYWQTVLGRIVTGDAFWKKGEFLSYFLLSSHSRLPAQWVLDHESLLQLATYLVQMTEFAIPVLLWVRRTRWWGITAGVILHGGICFSAKGLGLFLLTMLMSYTCFLEREDMDRIESALTRWTRRRGP
jgi:hypothetical protein